MALKLETEIKVDSEPCVVTWDDQILYVGAEDGSVRSFDANLTPGVSWAAHGVQLFAIAAHGGNVYTASNDGGIRVWSSQGDKVAELKTSGADICVLRVFGKELYAGDEAGNIMVYENNEEKARYNVLEEVKDLWVSPPFLFTVRDLDVTVTEIKPDESKNRFVTRHTMEGRASLRVAGRQLLVVARGGNNLQLHDASIETTFKKMHEVKASDMILTSMSVCGDYAWTAGWDGIVRRWKISADVLEPAGNINIGSCVNGLVCTVDNTYAIVAGCSDIYLATYETDVSYIAILKLLERLNIYTRTRQQPSGNSPPDTTPVWSEDPPFSMVDEELYTLFLNTPKLVTPSMNVSAAFASYVIMTSSSLPQAFEQRVIQPASILHGYYGYPDHQHAANTHSWSLPTAFSATLAQHTLHFGRSASRDALLSWSTQQPATTQHCTTPTHWSICSITQTHWGITADSSDPP